MTPWFCYRYVFNIAGNSPARQPGDAIWLHLQNRGQGRVLAPNMKKIIGERAMHGQMLAHFAACGLLLLTVFWPQAFVYPAGLAVIASNAWFLRNLLAAAALYRRQLLVIALASAR